MTTSGKKNKNLPISEINLQRIHDAYFDAVTDDSFYPAVYIIEPTNFCNFSCIMCPNSKYRSKSLGKMKMRLFKKIVDEIAPYAKAIMLYWVGEPLLHPKLPEMIRYIKVRSEARVIISTNASLLKGQLARDLINSGMDEIIIGMDGDSPETFEHIRVGGKFEEIVRNTENFLELVGNKNKPTVVIQFLEMKANSKETKAFWDHWSKFNCYPLITWIDTWAGQMAELKLTAQQLSPYEDALRKPCADLWYKMTINWQGQVTLCCHDWNASTILGSLWDQSVMEIWHSSYLKYLRNEHQKGNFSVHNLCKDCFEWSTVEDEIAHWKAPHIGYSYDPKLRESEEQR